VEMGGQLLRPSREREREEEERTMLLAGPEGVLTPDFKMGCKRQGCEAKEPRHKGNVRKCKNSWAKKKKKKGPRLRVKEGALHEKARRDKSQSCKSSPSSSQGGGGGVGGFISYIDYRGGRRGKFLEGGGMSEGTMQR